MRSPSTPAPSRTSTAPMRRWALSSPSGRSACRDRSAMSTSSAPSRLRTNSGTARRSAGPSSRRRLDSPVTGGSIVGPMARLSFGLSRELWIVQTGIFVNALGWGAVLPFEIIYLHDARGFSLGAAGLIVGTVTGVAVVAAPVAGPLIDRFGARAAAAGAAVALAIGYTGLAFAHGEGLAFAAAVVAGAGNRALLPAQSTLLMTLAPRDLRHRATAVSRVCTNAGFGLGGGLGGLVASKGLSGLLALFLLNAAT